MKDAKDAAVMIEAHLANLDWEPVFLSLQVAVVATLLVIATGIPLALFMARREFWGKSFLEAILLLPLVLPPVVTGYALLVIWGRNGPLGVWLENVFATRLIFTPAAAMLASAVVAFPLMYQSAGAAFKSLDAQLPDAASALGAPPRTVFWTVTLPLCWPGVVAGIVLSFARALGEFGATIMVAGNIAGQTTTVSTAIYMAAEDGDLQLAGIYSALLAILNLLFMVTLSWWLRAKARRRD